MRRLTLIVHVVVALVITAAALADDRRTDQSQLTIMSLNAEFLWDGLDPEEGNPQVQFPWKGVPDEALEHMEGVADIVIASNPDIVMLIEVENLDALNLFNSQFLSGRGYVAYLEKGRDTFTGQDVGLLTRIDPIDDRVEYDDRKGTSGSTLKSMSKNCVARFDVAGRKIAMVGVHFLSRPSDTSRVNLRQAQADAARSIAQQLNDEGFEIVVMGDFNDFDGAADSLDHDDNSPITSVLSLIRAMDPADSTDDLVNAASLVPKTQRFTAHWDQDHNGQVEFPGELSSIDHVLLAPSLAADITSATIPHDHDPTEVTDHFPVVVRLEMDGTTPQPPADVSFRIVALLPNPEGDENLFEQVFIKNEGQEEGDLDGWTLRDEADKTWHLAGSVKPGQILSIKRNGQSMAMNNSGDTIELISPEGNVVQAVTYARVDEEELVAVGP